MALRWMQRFAFAVVVLTATRMNSLLTTSAAAAETDGAALHSSKWLIKAWQTEDGLHENSATAMVQSPDGYLWFGTFNGLVRFDGVHGKSSQEMRWASGSTFVRSPSVIMAIFY